MKLHEVCRCKRLALGYDESDMARNIGIPIEDYVQFENGECEHPMMEKYIADSIATIMKALDKENYLKVKMMAIMLEIKEEPVPDKVLLETSYLIQAASDLNTHLIRKKKTENFNNEDFSDITDVDTDFEPGN